ncbi:glycosyltransferase [Saccharomonospora sp. NPDC006951]
MRILVVHNRYRSGQPSGENNVVDRETALLAGAGHDVEIFEKRSDDIETMSPVAKAAVPLRVPWNGAVRRELRQLLDRSRPDIVHIHNTFPLLSPSVVAACADTGTPAVATLHNYTPVCPPGTLFRAGEVCTDCVGRLPLPAVLHGCYRGSRAATIPLAVNTAANSARLGGGNGIARYFCISAAQRAMLIQAGLPAQRLAVKHNVVADPGIRRDSAGSHVLYLGRLTPEKGIPLLMKAWDELAASGGIGVPLVIAGAGPLADEVTAWARERPDVRYLGLRSQAECAELTGRAATVVAPSVWLEAFGLVVVEAMAAGVPTVAPSHGAFPELVEDGVTGLLHRPADAGSLAEALRRIVLKTAWNRDMGVAARLRYERDFTPEAGLDRLISGYREAIAGRLCEPV